MIFVDVFAIMKSKVARDFSDMHNKPSSCTIGSISLLNLLKSTSVKLRKDVQNLISLQNSAWGSFTKWKCQF